jgi:two-component system CheB/CheR fusion protein
MIHPQSGELKRLLEFLRRSRRFDFSGYKQASLMRRIEKRMRAVGVSSYADFIDHLELHPEEFPRLFNAILVNITSFFRDSPAWQRVVTDVVPQLLARKGPDQPVRVWSAGGASGEEAYTLAMVLAEALGREHYLKRVKIYATDIDEDALTQARKASYSASHVAGVPPELLAKYFNIDGDAYVFDAELRRVVAFGAHDLIRDAPVSRIDLLACRNTLMYFDADTQTEVLRRLHFALAESGVLFLGRAEMLLGHAHRFNPIDAKWRLFQKTPKAKARDGFDLLARDAGASSLAEGPAVSTPATLLGSAFEGCPAALIALDARGHVAIANERARALFHIGPRDVGRALLELEIGRRPVALGSLIERAYAERRSTTLKDVAHVTASGEMYFDVRVLPLYDAASLLGAEVGFFDVTPYRRLQLELDALKSELETASVPPQSATDGVDDPSELQSKVTELEIVNAELLSTTEELQSTNEELKTMIGELRARADDLARGSDFLRSILGGLRAAIVVVDREYAVQLWNPRAQALWGLRSDEAVGKHLLKLGLGVPVETLKGAIRSCLGGESEYVEIVVLLTTRRGRAIRRRVTCMPIVLPDGRTGAILLIEKEDF